MKQVALIVTGDVTELNKRLSTGYTVYTNYILSNGSVMFILSKYEQKSGSIQLRDVEPKHLFGSSYTSQTILTSTEG